MWPLSKKVLDANGKVTACDGVTVGMGIYDMDIVTMPAREAMRLRFPHIGILRSRASMLGRKHVAVKAVSILSHVVLVEGSFDVLTAKITTVKGARIVKFRIATRGTCRAPLMKLETEYPDEARSKYFSSTPVKWDTVNIHDDRTGEIVSLEGVGGFVASIGCKPGDRIRLRIYQPRFS